jgi:D-proline reductase (dithiol) PrdB
MSEVDPTHRIFVSYIDKSREFYLARGYGNPYRWAHNEDVPFTPLAKSLIKSRVALITTTALPGEKRSLIEVYAAPTVPPPVALFTDHRSWHKEATHTRDVESFLPIRRLEEFAAVGRIGATSPRFYGVPADFSQRRTVEKYAPAVLDLCRADAVDVAFLFPL